MTIKITFNLVYYFTFIFQVLQIFRVGKCLLVFNKTRVEDRCKHCLVVVVDLLRRCFTWVGFQWFTVWLPTESTTFLAFWKLWIHVDWLNDWLIKWLIKWLIDWLLCWLIIGRWNYIINIYSGDSFTHFPVYIPFCLTWMGGVVYPVWCYIPQNHWLNMPYWSTQPTGTAV